jgi:hypothetical protein
MVLFLDQDRLALARIEKVLAAIQKRLELLTETIMATMDDIRTRVEAQKTVTASVVTLLEDLRKQLQSAIQAGDPAAMQQIADDIAANTRALAEAVTAGTAIQHSPAEQRAVDQIPEPPPA